MNLEIVMISMLEHWSYCPRQCGLIHLESVWDENVFTLRGRSAHERADEAMTREERGRRTERALPIWSDALGLAGRADVVEFDASGRPHPIEYKAGKKRKHRPAQVQLCGQALCLEEMFGSKVPTGSLYFASSRCRVEIEIDRALRAETLSVIDLVRAMIIEQEVPHAQFDRRCRDCSLFDACLPLTMMLARDDHESMYEARPEANLQ